jgi:hypothetical protein
MVQKLESQAEAIRRVRAEFDGYADSVLLTELETSAAVGFSVHTLKFWRLNAKPPEKPTKGPTPVFLHGQVRYTAGELRRWRVCETTAVNNGPHALGVKAPCKVTTVPAKTIRRLTALGLEEL